MLIKANNVEKSYGNLKVLKQVSIEVAEKEIVAIAGPSGAGKSTLLHIIGTIDRADSGSVLIQDTDVAGLSPKKLAAFRRTHIGFVFQHHHLLPEFTALENVCIPAFINGVSKTVATKSAKELLTYLGLQSRLDHKPSELSGGELQRVAVARALINKPGIILADEPSGNLDSKNAEDLHNWFVKLRDNFGHTFVIVTHNKELASMSDRVLNMQDGRIV